MNIFGKCKLWNMKIFARKKQCLDQQYWHCRHEMEDPLWRAPIFIFWASSKGGLTHVSCWYTWANLFALLPVIFRRRKTAQCLVSVTKMGQFTRPRYRLRGAEWRHMWAWPRNVPIFNPIANKCRLCLREKFNIVLRPSEATLNSRQEIFAYCRHLQAELISVAPD